MTTLLLPHSCHRCGHLREAEFVYAGPHIKQICHACKAYVKFYSRQAIPDIKTVRQRIWFISGGNLRTIEAAKKAIGFTGSDMQIEYWNVYLKLLDDAII